MHPVFSIVVPIFNQCDSLELLLRCLEAQTFPQDRFECVLVDDGSTDGTSEWVEKHALPSFARVVSYRVNMGRSYARDLGCRESSGGIIVFLDGDMLPAPGLLAEYEQAFTRQELDIVSGGRYHLDIASQPGDEQDQLAELLDVTPKGLLAADACCQFQELGRHAKLGQHPHPVFEQLELQLRDVCRAHPGSLLCAYSFLASNTAVRRKALEETSGFNPCWRGFEDLELGVRLWEVGARFGFAQGADAYHLRGSEEQASWLNIEEFLTFFVRHPYHLVLAMQLWAYYHASTTTESPPPGLETLCALVDAGDGLSPADLCAEFRRAYGRPAPASCRWTKADAVKAISEWSPDEFAAAEHLEVAIERGLFKQSEGSRLYLDPVLTLTWFDDCTRFLQNFVYFPTGDTAVEGTPFQQSGDPADLVSFDVSGRYEVAFPPELLRASSQKVVLNIPLPIEHIYQTGVELGRCYPESLNDYVENSMVLGFPAEHLEEQEPRVCYDFEFRAHESAPREAHTAAPSLSHLARFLRPAFPSRYRARAGELLQHIVSEQTDRPFEVARAIYAWIQNHLVLVWDTPALRRPFYHLFDTGYGSCAQQIMLFVNLCRLAKIPSRVQVGAHFDAHFPGMEHVPFEVDFVHVGAGLFGHTWAEFYSPDHGWVPVELYGHGTRSINSLNTEREKRDELAYRIARSQDTLFGTLSPFRMCVCDRANHLPVLQPARVGKDWESLPELLARTRHTLRLTFDLPREQVVNDNLQVRAIRSHGKGGR